MTPATPAPPFRHKQQWIMPVCFFLSLAFTLGTIAICLLRGFSGMTANTVFSLSADIVSLCVCTVLLYTMVQDKKSMSEYTRIFALLITAESGVLFSDAVWWLIDGIKDLRFCNMAVNLLNYLFTTILAFYFWRYAVNALQLNGKFRKVTDLVMNILIVPAFLSILVNLFFPLYFRIDNEGFYQREPLFLISQAYFFIGFVLFLISLFITRVPVRERLITSSFVLIPVANQIITLYSFELSTEYSAMMISILLVFCVLVSKRENERILTEKKLYEAQVSIMTSQIQPHFIYNALGSIAMLCKLDPETAQKATITFSKYLRGNMDSLRRTEPVPFEQELDHLKKYLYIEKLRFGELLNIEYDIRTTGFVLPQLSIQPLVENAVKHGVGMAEDGGTVTISSLETDTAFQVIIADNGVGFDPSAQPKNDGRSHIGMENTRRRIKEMCGGEITVVSEIGKGTTATVILPKEGQPHENIMS